MGTGLNVHCRTCALDTHLTTEMATKPCPGPRATGMAAGLCPPPREQGSRLFPSGISAVKEAPPLPSPVPCARGLSGDRAQAHNTALRLKRRLGSGPSPPGMTLNCGQLSAEQGLSRERNREEKCSAPPVEGAVSLHTSRRPPAECQPKGRRFSRSSRGPHLGLHQFHRLSAPRFPASLSFSHPVVSPALPCNREAESGRTETDSQLKGTLEPLPRSPRLFLTGKWPWEVKGNVQRVGSKAWGAGAEALGRLL